MYVGAPTTVVIASPTGVAISYHFPGDSHASLGMTDLEDGAPFCGTDIVGTRGTAPRPFPACYSQMVQKSPVSGETGDSHYLTENCIRSRTTRVLLAFRQVRCWTVCLRALPGLLEVAVQHALQVGTVASLIANLSDAVPLFRVTRAFCSAFCTASAGCAPIGAVIRCTAFRAFPIQFINSLGVKQVRSGIWIYAFALRTHHMGIPTGIIKFTAASADNHCVSSDSFCL